MARVLGSSPPSRRGGGGMNPQVMRSVLLLATGCIYAECANTSTSRGWALHNVSELSCVKYLGCKILFHFKSS